MIGFSKRIFYILSLILTINKSYSLPPEFVYVDEIDKFIVQNLRYYSTENILNKKLNGYNKNRAILTRQAALALKQANKLFMEEGYKIVIYDAYRPQRAVNELMTWVRSPANEMMKNAYYPRVNKNQIFEMGFILPKSSHSRGSTVAVSIIPINSNLHSITRSENRLRDGSIIPILDDGTVNMGTSFDFMDKASEHNSSLINDQHSHNRKFLRMTMVKAGFKYHPGEWWKYTVADEIFKNKYFDFLVE